MIFGISSKAKTYKCFIWLSINCWLLILEMNIKTDNEKEGYSSIGYLSSDRLSKISPKFHKRHEFLIYLFQQIQDLILKTQSNSSRQFKVEISDNIDLDAFQNDPVKYAASNLPQAKKPIIDNVCLALMADFLAFTHTSFIAFEKREFAPGYANLRKPLQENLLLLTWIYGDDEDFFMRFLNDPPRDFKQMESDIKLRNEIFHKATSSGLKPFFEYDFVEKMIYDKSFVKGLAGPMTKAIHLFTNHKAIRTEDMNFNFIFKSYQDEDVYEVGYYGIASVYLHVYPIIFAICTRLIEPTKNLKLWLDIVLISCFEIIFLDKEPALFRSFEESLKDHLICMHCTKKFVLNKQNIPTFLMMEKVTCYNCGEHQKFPLYWNFCRNEAGC